MIENSKDLSLVKIKYVKYIKKKKKPKRQINDTWKNLLKIYKEIYNINIQVLANQ